MPRRRTKPQHPTTLYRVLSTLENEHAGGFYFPGTILPLSAIRRESVLILLERGALMFHIDPAALAALPEE